MPTALTRATYAVSEDQVPRMALRPDQLPPDLRSFPVLREGALDNKAMAEQGFPGATAQAIAEMGRLTGYLREFGKPQTGLTIEPGTNLAAASVVHLFKDEGAVLGWMSDIFLREFQENVGKAIAPGQELGAVDRFDPAGFADEAVGVRAVQRGATGLVSSTVCDFRVGRLLGVAYVVAAGDCWRRELAEAVGHQLERQIVRVVLGAG